MVEEYFKWKAIGYFAGWGIIIAVVIIIAVGTLVVWTYKKMCERRKKRLEKMMEKWKEQERTKNE